MMSTVLIPPHNLRLLRLLCSNGPFHVLVCYDTLTRRKELAVTPITSNSNRLLKVNVLGTQSCDLIHSKLTRGRLKVNYVDAVAKSEINPVSMYQIQPDCGECLYICIGLTFSRVWINRIRLPILLVVSGTRIRNISLSPFAP